MRMWRAGLWGAGFLAIVAGAAFFLRAPIAQWAIERALEAQGFEDPALEVSALTHDRVVIETLRAGGTARPLSIDRIEARFEPLMLVRERRLLSLELGPGSVPARISEDGTVSLAGRALTQGGDGEGSPPFDRPFDQLTISALTIALDTPEGPAVVRLDASLDMATGGDASFRAEADKAGLRGWSLANARIDGAVRLDGPYDGSGDGGNGLNAEMSFAGDLSTPAGAAQAADMTIAAQGAPWTALAHGEYDNFDGAAAIRLAGLTLNAAGAPAFEMINRRAGAIGGPIQQIDIEAGLDIDFSDGAVLIYAPEDAPLTAKADTGARLVIDSALDEPLAFWGREGAELSALISLQGGALTASSNLTLQQTEAGWRFTAPVRVGALDADIAALEEASAIMSGEIRGETIDLETTARASIRRASIGRFSLSNAPVDLRVLGSVDLASKTVTFRLPPDHCARLEAAGLAVAGQDMDAALTRATLCPSEAALARISYHGEPEVAFAGVIEADQARYRLGETRLRGRPTAISLFGTYLPAQNQTRAQGSATGGSVVFNEMLRFDQVDAAIDIRLDKDEMAIDATAARARVAEIAATGGAQRVAPVVLAGAFHLHDDRVTFDYRARTENGVGLGSGKGHHRLSAASGAATFDFDEMSFSPNGLQPDKLAPMLKGIIGATTGRAGGGAQFDWTSDGVTSTARFALDDITFRGPGLTVAQTRRVNGDLAFSSLWPVATDGPQAVTVGAVDFGAIQLEDGDIVFDMPGDDTLTVDYAIFPWFGGEMGVRGARATFTGGEAIAPLEVRSVDLSQILDYVDVDGLSGEGTLNGVLPLVVENGRASIKDGALTAEGPGAIRYVGKAGEAAAAAGGDAQIAFDVLRDLRYERLSVSVSGPLDGRLEFLISFEGTGAVTVNKVSGRVPVKYNISLDAALLELLNQANLSRNLQMQIEQAVDASRQGAGDGG